MFYLVSVYDKNVNYIYYFWPPDKS